MIFSNLILINIHLTYQNIETVLSHYDSKVPYNIQKGAYCHRFMAIFANTNSVATNEKIMMETMAIFHSTSKSNAKPFAHQPHYTSLLLNVQQICTSFDFSRGWRMPGKKQPICFDLEDIQIKLIRNHACRQGDTHSIDSQAFPLFSHCFILQY